MRSFEVPEFEYLTKLTLILSSMRDTLQVQEGKKMKKIQSI